jgi:hypothetical protein
VGVEVGAGVLVGGRVGVSVGATVGVSVGVGDGVALGIGVAVAVAVGTGVGVSGAWPTGAPVAVGLVTGDPYSSILTNSVADSANRTIDPIGWTPISR